MSPSEADAALDQLSKRLPDLERHPPEALDGVALAASLAPADAAEMGRALTEISAAGLVAIPRGGGRHLHLGNPPARADLCLSTHRLAGIEALEPAERVCRAAAGTPLAELRRAAASHAAEIPIDGPGDATLGGALAAASTGPRSHVFGRARDAVLGLDVVLGSGEVTRCGGRVVKNVTGYDLAKLYTGSLGSLGVITAAWLRLRPAPE
jgi:glycolate oxidase FAD binding subunit